MFWSFLISLVSSKSDLISCSLWMDSRFAFSVSSRWETLSSSLAALADNLELSPLALSRLAQASSSFLQTVKNNTSILPEIIDWAYRTQSKEDLTIYLPDSPRLIFSAWFSSCNGPVTSMACFRLSRRSKIVLLAAFRSADSWAISEASLWLLSASQFSWDWSPSFIAICVTRILNWPQVHPEGVYYCTDPCFIQNLRYSSELVLVLPN